MLRARVPPRATPVGGANATPALPRAPSASGCGRARRIASIAATACSAACAGSSHPIPPVPCVVRQAGSTLPSHAARGSVPGSWSAGCVRAPPQQYLRTLSASRLQAALSAMRSLRLQVPRHAVAQKLPLPRPRHRALLPIHLELEPPSRNAVSACHHPLPAASLPT